MVYMFFYQANYVFVCSLDLAVFLGVVRCKVQKFNSWFWGKLNHLSTSENPDPWVCGYGLRNIKSTDDVTLYKSNHNILVDIHQRISFDPFGKVLDAY